MPRFNVGDTFLLWEVELALDAYHDQFGRTHEAWILRKAFTVEITAVRTDVPGCFDYEPTYRGYQAVSETGESFEQHWKSYPDDGCSRGCIWRKTHWVQPGPGEPTTCFVQAREFQIRGFPVVTPEGEPVFLEGIARCLRHNRSWFFDVCMACKWEAERGAQQTIHV